MHLFGNRSVKYRITMWYAVFITLIVILLVGALRFSQDISSRDYYMDQLRDALEQAATEIKTLQDVQTIDLRHDSGVYLSILREDATLLAGERKFRVKPHEYTLHIRNAKDYDFWFLMDKRVDLIDGTSLWLRAYISSAVSDRFNDTVMLFLLLAIPVLLFVSFFGGLWLTRRAFYPIDTIIQTVQGISDTTDLKQRLPVECQDDEVGKLSDAFNGMLARLDSSIENEKRFISDASHELRTPISVISAQSEFALKPGRTLEEKDAALKTIQTRSVNAGRMLSQLMLLSRMDYEKLPMKIEHINLSELLSQISQESEEKADRMGIALHTEVEQDVYFDCDELLIMRAIDNLLENAIRYGRLGGDIWSTLLREEGAIVIQVRDNGIGISEKDQPMIWQRFFQANKSEQAESGFGLGLSIVRWIVEAHGGTIHVSSVLGAGSCFTIRFPQK